MKAMIFCAGLGTRLKPYTDTMPKALVPLAGKPLLEQIVERLKGFGFNEFVVNVHHYADMVEQFIESKKSFGVNVVISDERDLLLDTGGGLKKAATLLNDGDPFLIHNVDIISNIDIDSLYQQHKASNALASLAVSNRLSSRYFLFDEQMTLSGWKNIKSNEQKISRVGDTYLPFAFNGIHVVSPEIFDLMGNFDGKFSIVDLYLELAKKMRLVGVDVTKNHIIDVGKPAALADAVKLFGL